MCDERKFTAFQQEYIAFGIRVVGGMVDIRMFVWVIFFPNSNWYISPFLIVLCRKDLFLLSAHR